MKEFLKKQTLYSIRWQLSTPILSAIAYPLRHWLGITSFLILIGVGNFIGSFIFYWIDKWIFRKEQDK